MARDKIIMIGIDGASWEMIDKFRDDGLLPTFNKLIENGTRAPLKSTPSTFTELVWSTISTGKYFEQWDMKLPVSNRGDIGSLTLWDIIEEHGYSIGLMQWMLTYPPRDVNGFIIPGRQLDRPIQTSPEKYLYIKRLEQLENKLGNRSLKNISINHITAAIRYLVSPPSALTLKEGIRYVRMILGPTPQEVASCQSSILNQSVLSDLFTDIYRREQPDFAAIYVNAIDQAAHHTWQYYEPERFPDWPDDKDSYGSLIPRSYVNTDQCIKHIIDVADEDTTIVLVSDHGTGPAANGDPVYTPSPEGLFEVYGEKISYVITRNNLYLFFDESNERKKFKEWIDSLTYNSSKIFKSNKVRDKSLEIVVDESIFDSTTLPKDDTGSTDIDTLIKINHYEQGQWGTHTRNGIFLAYGPGIKSGYELDTMSVVDVTPTILHYLGLPIGKDMDGTVHKDVFTDLGEPQYIDSYDKQPYSAKYILEKSETDISQAQEDRLKDLGYL